MTLLQLKSEIKKQANSHRAKSLSWFFKTGPGDYGEGDKFLGLSTPQMRKISSKYKNLPLSEAQKLLKSPYHEERSIAVQILVHQFPNNPKTIYDFYLKNTQFINNWDLVDISCHKIVGAYLLDKPRDILYSLAKSLDLWERRISIISTYAFIRNNDFKDSLTIAKILLPDKQDLIHKAVGWMLREVGKKDETLLKKFIKENYSQLPRTALRYAIERFPAPLRQQYLRGTFPA